jgi:hypothetical protein
LTKWVVLAIGAMAVLALYPTRDIRAAKSIVLGKGDRRFDHDAHASMVKAKGITEPKCGGACHQVTASGKFV